MDNRIIKSPYSVDIPATDVPSYVFTSGTSSSRDAPQYFDATTPSRCFSLAEAEGLVKRFASGLQSLGLEPGDRVLLYSGNQLFFPVVIWATIAAGYIFTGASPTATVSELEYQLRDSGAKILLTSPDRVHVSLKAAAQVGLATSEVYLFHDPAQDQVGKNSTRIPSWTEIWRSPEDSQSWSWKSITSFEKAKSTTAIINYSSGTTGMPKGVELSHFNLIANTEQVVFKRGLVADTSEGRARKSRLDTSGERWLAVTPMYHAYGQTYFALTAPRLGAKVFIAPKFNVSQYLLYMDIYRITFMNAVPTIYSLISKQNKQDRFNLKAVENVTSGSAPLDPGIGKAVAQGYLRPETKVKQGWGMTETTCTVTGFAPDDKDDGRSIGWLHPNCVAKIVSVPDRDFSTTATNEVVGELWVAGPVIMKGYWKKPKETADVIVYEDGHRWLRTGDVGYIDKRGRIYIVDRLKELIKVKGLQVAPAELESGNGLEFPRAFVVRENANVSAEDLFEFIKQRFASHKWLTGGVYFIDSIPRTGTGKVMRRVLVAPDDKIRGKL